jgi:RNA polymerase sigma-70 factor, ECF subfamily
MERKPIAHLTFKTVAHPLNSPSPRLGRGGRGVRAAAHLQPTVSNAERIGTYHPMRPMDATALPLTPSGLIRCTEIASSAATLPWWNERASEAVFEEFVLAHRRRVHGLLVGLISDVDEAEDLTQEVFVRVWRARRQFRPGTDPWPWLASIAVNAARDAARRRRRRPVCDTLENQSELSASGPCPMDSASDREILERVRASLPLLPERQRQVLVLHAHAGLELSEIAKVLRIRANAVRVSLHHARKRLRALIDGRDGGRGSVS